MQWQWVACTHPHIHQQRENTSRVTSGLPEDELNLDHWGSLLLPLNTPYSLQLYYLCAV
jgi:hypothetical protein